MAPDRFCDSRGHWVLQTARKPNSVLDDHSSRRRITAALEQPTRRFRLAFGLAPSGISPPGRTGPIRLCRLERSGEVPAYLVLLRVGFTMPRLLPAARCALTAPFHPYPRSLALAEAVSFLLHWPSGCLEASVPDVIRHTALRSSDFPLPNPACARSGSDHPAACMVPV